VSRLVYVIGEPGAGKTTLVDAALAGLDRMQASWPVPHELLYSADELLGVHLGRRRAGFGGTDALSLSIQPGVLRWLAGRPPALLLAEGDRLANASFFDAVGALGHTLDLVLLQAPPGVAAGRRTRRGARQDPTWVKGRITKVARLAARYHPQVLDATRTPRELAERLTRILGWEAR
jgi:ribose 1,5-bisphosphokinase PhnN